MIFGYPWTSSMITEFIDSHIRGHEFVISRTYIYDETKLEIMEAMIYENQLLVGKILKWKYIYSYNTHFSFSWNVNNLLLK